MQMDGHPDRLLQTLDQQVGVHRSQQSGHVLDADRVGPEVLQPFAHLDESFQPMDGTHGVGDGRLDMFPAGFDLLDRPFEIADVVEGVEDTEDVDAVGGRALDEPVQHVVRIMPVSDDVLPAEEHLQLGVRHRGAQRPQPFPGILLEEA